MLYRCLLPLLALLLPGFGQATDRSAEAKAAVTAAPAAMATISAADLRRHAEFFASAELEGRMTATPGQRAAKRQIARHFQRLGLEPLGDVQEDGARSFFQRWPITVWRTGPASGLFDAAGAPMHRHGAYVLGRGSGTDPLLQSGPLLLSPAARLDELDSLAGVIPIITLDLRDDPKDITIYSAFNEGMSYQAGHFRRIASALARRDAKMGVVVLRRFNVSFLASGNLNYLSPGKPLVAQGHTEERGGRDLPLGLQQRIPLLIIEADDAEAVFRAFDVRADTCFANDSAVLRSDDVVTLGLHVERVATFAENVVARWPGKEAQGEALVYSAHMDHVGRAANGGVFFGADDNGSGTSALMELAEAYASVKAEERPRRSAIFLAVSGEENGLWGSEWYSDHPTWPIERIIANINVDMIGRNTEAVPRTKISITPTHEHQAYSSLAADAAFLGQAFELSFANGDRFYERSDHYHFAKRGIPVMFLCDDEHPDYHMPTDTVDKLDFEKMERVVRLLWLTGWRTLHAEGKPKVLGRQAGW